MIDDRGFTLVELVVVVVVIGILATIAIPRYTEMRDDALRSTLQSDLRSVSASQVLFHMDSLRYGSTLVELDAETSEGVTVTIEEATSIGWSATATHTGVTGTCVLYYGRATPVDPATTPGVVTCDF